MRKILFVVLLTIPTMLFAQQFEDIVTLRNGSVIRGIIIDRVPNESIRLQTSDGNIFAFSYDEIQTLGREIGDRRNVQRRNQREVGTFNRPHGYMGEVVLGPGLGADGGDFDFSLSVINGYRFLPQFAMGLGVGFHTFEYSRWTLWDSRQRRRGYGIPIFLHLRSDFLNRRVSPFIVVNSGYDVLFHSAFAETILGCSFNVSGRNRLSVGFSGRANDRTFVLLSLSVGFSW